MTITFYDLPCSKPDTSWSPNTLKTRYSLNIKGLEFKTVWVDYPDIPVVIKGLGVEPTQNGYTVPVIKDDSTGAVVSDSFKIAQYLDKTYPHTPKLIPHNTDALQLTFQSTFTANNRSYFAFLVDASYPFVNPESKDFFRRTREAAFGKKLEELSPPGTALRQEHMKAMRESFEVMNSWYSVAPQGPYLLGESPSFADVTVVGFLQWFAIVLPDEWASEIASLHNGRWAELLELFEKYYK